MKKLSDGRAAAVVFTALALIFWHFRCRTFGPGDSGQHVLAALTWSVSRPPGYPLYDLLGWLWTRLPWSEPAAAVDGLSGLCAAGAAALSFLVLRRQGCGRPAALAAAGLMAFSPLFWYYAEVAEVRSLNDLLAAAATLLLLEGRLAWFAAALGLGAGHHPTFVLLLPAFAWAAWPRRRELARRWPALAAVFAAALAAPYLILWLRLRLGPPPAYNPDRVRAARDVALLFLRQRTGGYVNMFARRHAFFGGFSLPDLARHAGWLASCLASGLGPAGAFAVVAGAAALARGRRERLVFWALWAALPAAVFLLISSQQMPAIDPQYLRAVSLRFYLLPMMGLFALAAFGLDALLGRVDRRFGWALAAAAWAAPLGLHPLDLRRRDWPRLYGEAILRDSGPRDFVVLAADDSIVATAYLDVVEKRAGDRVFLLPWLFYYPAYIENLTARHPGLAVPRTRDGAVSGRLDAWLRLNPGRGLCAEAVDAGPLGREARFVGMRGVLAVARGAPQPAAEAAREAAAFRASAFGALRPDDVLADTQEVYFLKAAAAVERAYGPARSP